MLVDDSATVLLSISGILAKAGFQVVTANCAEDGQKKLAAGTKPDLLIFVDEAIAGNDAVERARLFNESVAIGGTILTKTDADAKGGSAISIAYITGKPVLFLGVGQTYPDLVKFEPEWLVDRLMGEAEA